MNCKNSYMAHRVPLLPYSTTSSDDNFPISKIHSSEINYFLILTFFTKKNCYAKSAKNVLHDKYHLFCPLTMLKQPSVFVIRWQRYRRKCDFAQISWKKTNRTLTFDKWKVPLFMVFFLRHMIASPLPNKSLSGFPVFLLRWFLRIFLPGALVFFSVLGVFDPLVGGVGGPKNSTIFFSMLDDRWWNPFVAS